VEFSEHAGLDTGTIVGEVERGGETPRQAEQRSRAQGVQVLPAIRAPARNYACSALIVTFGLYWLIQRTVFA
jgi:hypothetical protein